MIITLTIVLGRPTAIIKDLIPYCMMDATTTDPKMKLSNYSYLEGNFYSHNSTVSQVTNVSPQVLEDVLCLLQDEQAKILISHSSIHSQFSQLSTALNQAFDPVQILDFSDLSVFRTIRHSDQLEQGLVLVSVFGQRYERYAPALANLLHKIQGKNQIKVLIYSDCTQSTLISSLAQKTGNDFLQVSFSSSRPYEVSTSGIFKELKKFLLEESKQTDKMDVVLFHPMSEKLLKDITYMLKTQRIFNTTQLVHDPNRALSDELSNVIIVNSSQTLFSWKYDLSNVYLVLDSGLQSKLYFDYDFACYTQQLVGIDFYEHCRRMNLISSRVGQYILQKDNAEMIKPAQEICEEFTDLYCLGMAYFHQIQTIENPSKNVSACLQMLKNNKILVRKGEKLQLANEQIFTLAHQNISPIFANMFLDAQIAPQYLHYLIISYSILTRPSLRVVQDHRPLQIWCQSGYLHSCLDLVIKVSSLQKNKDSTDEEDTLSLNNLAEKYGFDESVYESIWTEATRIKTVLGIQVKEQNESFEIEEANELLQILLHHLKAGVAFFSGSARLGYFVKGKQSGILPHSDCLMKLLNQKPSFILLIRLKVEDGVRTIKSCNYVEDQVMISAYGALPITSKQSFGECQIEFHNISGSIFVHLSKYNSIQVQNFQNENQCSVELNEDIGTISLQCSKLREKVVRETFESLLQEIRETFQKQDRIVRFSTTLKAVIGMGGTIKQLVVREGDEQEILDCCVVRNLDPEVDIVDLKDLFDDFVQIKNIQIVKNKSQNEAIVTLYSFDDYKLFTRYFQGCVYFERQMIIKPYVPKTMSMLQEKYLLMEWNHWKSKGEGKIVMENESHAKKVVATLTEMGYQTYQKGQKVNVNGLNFITDERDLEMMVYGCGVVKEVEVVRFYSANAENDYIIDRLVDESFKGDNIVYTSSDFVKGKNGYRSKRIKFQKDQVMKETYFLMNEIVGRIGTGKLYSTPTFTYPIRLPNDESFIPIYQDIILEISEELNRARPFQTEVVNERDNKFLIVKANQDSEVDVFVNYLADKLQGTYLNISIEDQSLLFSDLAKKKIQSLEKKFICKFTWEVIDHKIKVLTRVKNVELIQKQIHSKLVESFNCVIPVYANAFRFVHSNFQKIKSENKGLASVKVSLEKIARTIILNGRIELIDKAKNELEIIVQQMKQKKEIMSEGEQYCGLCCEEFRHPFKLQGCGHKFCFACLQSTIKVTLKDLTMYPIKCPQCMESLLVSDLNCLCAEDDWKQIIKMSVNHFVFTHPGQYTFCFTTSCPQINKLESGGWFRCRECKKGYCLSCKLNYHPGMTCDEARYGSDRLLKEYMDSIGGRTCANKKCKAPIVRISGCYKVQCSRCNKSMCFKCPESQMVAYETCGEAYDHLDKKHGGCF